jgi:glycine cleavage system aminomethyltransferase T
MSDAFAFIAAGDGSVALSPLFEGTAAAGAGFETRDGWEVPVRFAEPAAEALACRESVGWTDVSHLPKWELQGPAAGLDSLAALPVVGDRLASRADGAWWCRMTPERALVVGGAQAPEAGADVHVLDVTSQFGALRIAGPQARETLARFCALDLRPRSAPPRSFRPGSIARTPGFLVCEAPERYLVLFGAAYGAYVWEVVADAGARLGGRPVGVDVIAEPADAAPALAEGAPSHA